MKIRNLIYTALFTALIAVGAYIRVPAPAVPFTLQFQFVNLAAILLGKKYGAAAAAAYVALGLAGVPVFAGGGGIGYVLKPTFGYLIGFIAGAYAAGAYIGKTGGAGVRAAGTEAAGTGAAGAQAAGTPAAAGARIKRIIAASFINLLIVYATGAAYFFVVTRYYLNTPIGAGALFLQCFALTAPGDIVLCIAGAGPADRLISYYKKSLSHK